MGVQILENGYRFQHHHISAQPHFSEVEDRVLSHFMVIETVKQKREEAKDPVLERDRCMPMWCVCVCIRTCVCVHVYVCASEDTVLWGHPHLLCNISDP